nr:Gag-Pol polyprotein [Tanacetum cinerariifolium]
QQPTEGELNLLFEAMYDDYFGGQPSAAVENVTRAQEPQTKDHPLEQVIGEPSRPVLTRNQLRSNGDMCIYALTVSTMEPKNVKEAMTDPAWIESMQEELIQLKRMDVWVLVPIPDNISPLTLKWIFKNKHDEEQTVIRNKSRLVVRGYRQEEGLDFEESFAPGIRNVSPNGVFSNEVYVSNLERFAVIPSSSEFRLCNSDEWRFGNHSGTVRIHG